jgi:murein L,D-transpeptidase YcbB/YkuD
VAAWLAGVPAWAPSVWAQSASAPAPTPGATAVAPWFDDRGRPTALARAALALLADAPSHGLRAADYDAGPLMKRLQAAADGQPPEAAARLAAHLAAAMRRLLADLHDGRVDPRTIHHAFDVSRRAAYDADAALKAAVAAGRLDEAVQQALPPLPQYAQLRAALAKYRGLGDPPAWARPLPPLSPAPGSQRPAKKLEPGGRWPGLPLLAERLALLGDLAPSALAGPAPETYDGPLVEALTAFQHRHGLAEDGVIGPATLAALAVSPARRAAQIALSLERLRWTPLTQAPRMILINIPEFVLRAYELDEGRIRVRETMRVIVGGALDKRTPLFDEAMRFIEFSPYWNVPPSIARKELIPRLRRDPGHFASQGFEFFGPGGADPVLTSDKLDAVLRGQLRIRQRPGPKNALGDIKFVFPNRDHIFLHHTPSTGLFERDRRDLSHGCIRVENPVALAQFVLAHDPAWTESRIVEAMDRGESHTIALGEPIPVLIAYGTTLVKDDRIYFYEDIYGHDAALAAALKAPRPPLTP